MKLSLGHKNRRILGRVRPVESCRRDVGEVEGTEQEKKAEKRCSNKVIIMTIHMKRIKKKEQQIALNSCIDSLDQKFKCQSGSTCTKGRSPPA